MSANLLTEQGLTDATDEPQPETTPLVSAEPDVIDGEVTAIIEPPETIDASIPPKQKPYWLLIPFTILCCVVFLAVSLLVPLLSSSATVLLIPTKQYIATTTTIQVQGRTFSPLTLSQSQTVPATGKRHQDASKATGTVTFYNGLLTEQTIAAGTILTGADGVHIITTEAAVIPPASNTTPPTFGHTTVLAHALSVGEQGNIQSYDINGSCCSPSVLVKNTAAFSRGQSERDYPVVSRSNIATTAATLKASLLKSEQAALQAQLIPGEEVIHPSCNQQIQSDHQVGEEAKEVTVTVAETCSAVACDTQALHNQATQVLTQEVINRFGTDYSLLGDLSIQVVHATITDQAKGIATLAVNLAATYIYQLTPGERQHLIRLIAGQSTQQAITTLLQMPGIQGVHITTSGSAHQTLPEDPTHIQIVLLYTTTP